MLIIASFSEEAVGSILVLRGDQLAPFWSRISFRASGVLSGKLLFPEPGCFLPWEPPRASELTGHGEDGDARPLARVDTMQDPVFWPADRPSRVGAAGWPLGPRRALLSF